MRMDGCNKASPDPNWDEIWDRNCRKSLIIFRIYSVLRARSYRELFTGLDLEGKDVIEIGGGSGQIGHMLCKEFKCRMTLIDNSDGAFRFHSKFNISGVNYIRGDVFDHKGVYFLVYSDGLIEHFSNDKRTDMIMRHALLCSDDGYIAFFVPKKSFFVDMFLSLRGFYEKKYTMEEIILELIEKNFKILKTVEDFHMVGVLCKVKK